MHLISNRSQMISKCGKSGQKSGIWGTPRDDVFSLNKIKYSPVLEWFLHQFMSCYSLDHHFQNQKLSLMVMVTFFRYQYVRLDGTMSIKKRQKIVDRFNDPHVSSISTNKNDWSIYGSLDQIVIFGTINPILSWFWNALRFKASTI